MWAKPLLVRGRHQPPLLKIQPDDSRPSRANATTTRRYERRRTEQVETEQATLKPTGLIF